MLKYNIALKKISSLFLKYRNNIIIFTEDKYNDKEFYITLLKRLVDQDVIINDIIPLGCKNNVITSCINDINKDGKIYIVDGDLELITDENPKDIDHLFVLDSYCIENYLIDENAAIRFLHYNNVGSEELIKKELCFQKWLGYNYEPLSDLFIHLAFAKSIGLGPDLKSAHHFLSQNLKQTILNSDKVRQRIVEVKNTIIDKYIDDGILHPHDEYESQISMLYRRWETTIDNYLRIVSGKDYLLPLFQFRLAYCKSKHKNIFPKDQLKILFASHCDLTRLASLREFIYKHAN